MNQNKALFLDRDGVINFDPGDYTTSLDQFEILPNVLTTLKKWYDLDYLLIVITNQGGLDKKLYDLDELHAMHNFFQGKCVANGFEITHFYFCPHHPEFTGNCLCRKPGSLLIEKAIHRYNIDPSQSFMVGDRDRDVQCAESAGVKGIKIIANSDIPLPENLIQTN